MRRIIIDLPLTIIYETERVIKLGWTPSPNCLGYVFYVNDKRVSNTWNPEVSEVRFNKVAGAIYKVRAVGIAAEGVYPPNTPSNAEEYSADPYGSAVYSH